MQLVICYFIGGQSNNSSDNTQIASISNLLPQQEYIVLVVKDETVDNMISSDNLLYIAQNISDNNGNISFSYIGKEEFDKPIVFACGIAEPKEITLDTMSTSLLINETEPLIATIKPKLVIDSKIEWKSENESIANVNSEGIVTAVGIGTTTITAKTTNGKIATCSIIVTEKHNLVGDVNGDEKVSLIDYAMVLAHVKRTTLLTGEELSRADVNGDGKVTLIDYAMILAHVKKTTLLW